MSTIVNIFMMKQLLSIDLGKGMLLSSAYDSWFSFFNNRPAVGLGDLSFGEFTLLPYVKSGLWSYEINIALQAAKAAAPSPPTLGTLNLNGVRTLTLGSDFWNGGLGSERVNAGGGNDVLALGAGNDTSLGGTGNDLMFGERGADVLFGEAGNDTVFGGADRDLLYGWHGNDMLFGGTGNDGIFGNAGNDTIFGGDGNDYICGGSGKDIVVGGAGSDTFAFRGQAPNSLTVIKDFDIFNDRQFIMASVANGPLRPDMIKAYAQGLIIEFSENRSIYYENVSDVNALFHRMSLFE